MPVLAERLLLRFPSQTTCEGQADTANYRTQPTSQLGK